MLLLSTTVSHFSAPCLPRQSFDLLQLQHHGVSFRLHNNKPPLSSNTSATILSRQCHPCPMPALGCNSRTVWADPCSPTTSPSTPPCSLNRRSTTRKIKLKGLSSTCSHQHTCADPARAPSRASSATRSNTATTCPQTRTQGL